MVPHIDGGTESHDAIWNRKVVKWRLAGQLHPSFCIPSFDSRVGQIEDCTPKTEAVMDTCSEQCIPEFSQNILIIYFLSHRQAQYLSSRQLVNYCCYFGWCNSVIFPSGDRWKSSESNLMKMKNTPFSTQACRFTTITQKVTSYVCALQNYYKSLQKKKKEFRDVMTLVMVWLVLGTKTAWLGLVKDHCLG